MLKVMTAFQDILNYERQSGVKVLKHFNPETDILVNPGNM